MNHGCIVLATPKRASQDWGVQFESADGTSGFVLCDGIGSWAASGEVARDAAACARAVMIADGLDGIEAAFAAASDAVRASSEPAGTTMIVAAARDGALAVGHIGNGALLVAVNAADEGPPRLLWTNLLLPQVTVVHGRESTSALTYEDETHRQPSVLTVRGLRRPFLVIGCTDGVYSREQVEVGRVGDGSLWEARPAALSAALDVVEARFPTRAEPSVDAIRDDLREALADVCRDGGLDDDVAVGVLQVA